MLLDQLEECRAVSIYCEGTGVYTRFYLTAARGGTFVDGCFGAVPQSVGMKVFGAVAGSRYMRSWLSQSLARLKQTAERVPAG